MRMSTAALQRMDVRPGRTSVGAKLLNLFVSPGAVFEEVVISPPRVMNYLVPTALVCLSSLVVLNATTNLEHASTAVGQLLEGEKITQTQAAWLNAHWQGVSRMAIGITTFAGVAWSAFVIWFVGKIFLKSRFAFGKALEVAGLSGTILVLGTIVTGLLAAATGDPLVRPALSLFCSKLSPDTLLRTACGLLDFFHLWATAVLTIGLSRLASVTIKESAFWIAGYWLFARIAVVLLG